MPNPKDTLGGDIGYPDVAPTVKPDPRALAGQLAVGYQQALPPGSPGATPPVNPHMLKMQDAAEAAKQQYMQENGVDENGDPVSK